MRLVVSPRAVQRLGEIADFITLQNPSAAQRVEAAIRHSFALLVAHPYAGRRVQAGLRRLNVPRLPFAIFYRVDEHARKVTIATIRHAAQRALPDQDP